AFGNFSSSSFSLYNHDILDPTLKQQFDLSNNYRYGNVTYKTPLNEKWDVRSGLSYSFNKNQVKLDGVPYEETEEDTHGKSVLGHTVSDQVELRFGGEVISRHYSASHYNDTINQTLSRTFRETITSAFAESEMYASNQFVAKVGGRFEYNSLN